MTRVQQISSILTHYFSVAWGRAGASWDPENQEEIEELARIIANEPKPLAQGNGTCICESSPEYQEKASQRMGYSNWLDECRRGRAGNALLDHRCSRHGEQAQPRLWGRHKTLTLSVTGEQWASLGVVYAIEESIEAKI